MEQSRWHLLQLAALPTATHQLDQVPGCYSPRLRMKRAPSPARETLVSFVISKGSGAMGGVHVAYDDKRCPPHIIFRHMGSRSRCLTLSSLYSHNNPVCHLHSFTLCLLVTPNELFCPNLFSGSGQVPGTPLRVPCLGANRLQPYRFFFLCFLSTAIKFLQLNHPSSI